MGRITTKENIMHPMRLFLTAISFFALLHSPSASAVQRDYFPTPSDYSLEIQDGDGEPMYLPVPAATGNVFARYGFNRIKNWQRPPEQSQDASAFQVKCLREGDAIKLYLTIIFGPIEKFRTLPREGLRGQLIGSYSARLGETVSLQELADFGIEPINITVVPSGSRRLDSSEIDNKTKAIEVVRADEARGDYRVEVRNISSKNVIALYVRGRGSVGFAQTFLLIAPGQVHKTGIHDPGSGWGPPQGRRTDRPEDLLPTWALNFYRRLHNEMIAPTEN
jgi:hypothetical protein